LEDQFADLVVVDLNALILGTGTINLLPKDINLFLIVLGCKLIDLFLQLLLLSPQPLDLIDLLLVQGHRLLKSGLSIRIGSQLLSDSLNLLLPFQHQLALPLVVLPKSLDLDPLLPQFLDVELVLPYFLEFFAAGGLGPAAGVAPFAPWGAGSQAFYPLLDGF
jgi:hypothetical protein